MSQARLKHKLLRSLEEHVGGKESGSDKYPEQVWLRTVPCR